MIFKNAIVGQGRAMWLTFVFVGLGLILPAVAGDLPSLTSELSPLGGGLPSDPVLPQLAQAGVFAFGGVGDAKVVSQEYLDFRAVLARPTALTDFQNLFLMGNPQGKCYALVGIYILDPKGFQAMTFDIKVGQTMVMTIRGGARVPEPMAKVVEKIKGGRYH